MAETGTSATNAARGKWSHRADDHATRPLRQEGVRVNHTAGARHMQIMGLRATYPGPNLSKHAQQHAVFPYLLRGLKIE